MSHGRFQLAGARGARRSLDALERLAGPVASLCQAVAGVDELAGGAPVELVRPPLAHAMATLTATLDTLDERAPAPTAPRSPSRPHLPAAARIERPRSPMPGPSRPRRAPPGSLPTPSDAPAGAAALVEAWRALASSSPAATPAPRAALITPAARRPLPAASSDPGAALATLIANVPGAAAARVRPIAPAPTPRPRPIAAVRADAEPPPIGAPPRSRADAPSITAPARLDAITPTPPAPSVPPGEPGPAPRGLSGLVGWWRDHGQPGAAARAADAEIAPPVAAPRERATTAPPLPTAPLVTTPSPSARLAGFDALSAPPSAARPEPEAPALAALGSLDDVTRALERVLVRELRRHGVAMEEP